MSPTHKKTGSERHAVSATDVARLAGVSQATVSRAFTEGASISRELKEKVLAAAEVVGYQPNVIARSLTTSRTKIIGLVMGDFDNPFYSIVIEELSLELQRQNLHPLLFVVAPGGSVDEVLPQLLQYRVDAILIVAATVSSSMAQVCLKRGLPVVLFNRSVPDAPTHVVATDNYRGGWVVADLLVGSGHKRLGYISGHVNTTTSQDRQRGFLDRLELLGVTGVNMVQGNYSYRGAMESAMSLLKSTDRPEAIFCANDLMACGVVDAARVLGIDIPGELSIVGFDDIPQARWDAYSLTTLRGQVDAMVRSATDLLVRLSQSQSPERVSITLPAELVIRRSARVSQEAIDAIANSGLNVFQEQPAPEA
jgi:DNA-binding LacI/PurR family transcriptional regulator